VRFPAILPTRRWECCKYANSYVWRKFMQKHPKYDNTGQPAHIICLLIDLFYDHLFIYLFIYLFSLCMYLLYLFIYLLYLLIYLLILFIYSFLLLILFFWSPISIHFILSLGAHIAPHSLAGNANVSQRRHRRTS
jgi:hypothetical protein